MTRIERKEWRKLARVGFITRFYIETLTIVFIMRELPPMNIFVAVAAVVTMALLLTKLTSYAVKYIKSFYEIVDAAPVVKHHYVENGEHRCHEVQVSKVGSLL